MTTDNSHPAPTDARATVLTAEQLATIQERCDKATPGPWKRDAQYFVAEVPQGRPGGEVIGSALPSSSHLRDYPRGKQIANAEFITHARDDMPALICSHRALTAALARCVAAAQALYDNIVSEDDDHDRFWSAVTALGLVLASPEVAASAATGGTQ